ncbi:uncharacterized protein [Paramisgurnus dabryanus]|uniref:uncharacterized protein isoform X3 n=1 Tax=Paramisgurnus dabryanus TaxID=90735 RepID=UPI0031F3B4C8
MKTISLLFIISLFINGVFGDEVKSVMVGDSLTLHTDTEIETVDLIDWRFDGIDHIAQINVEANIFSVRDVLDRRFRDRLQVNNQTGDLTITKITTQHTGLYQLEIRFSVKIIRRTFSVNGLSSYVLAGLCVGVLVIVALTAAGGFYYHYRFPKATILKVRKGHSVRLETDVENIKTDDLIEWRFKPGAFQKTIIAKIQNNEITGGDERFSRNVQLNSQNGSLFITDFTADRSGLYELKLSSGGITSYKRFRLIVINDFNIRKYLAEPNWPWKWKQPVSQYEL